MNITIIILIVFLILIIVTNQIERQEIKKYEATIEQINEDRDDFSLFNLDMLMVDIRRNKKLTKSTKKHLQEICVILATRIRKEEDEK